MDQIGGEGIVVMTPGALGHTGAQGRARGFSHIVKKYPKVEVVDTTPADWDVTKVASIWDSLLTKFPKIDAAYFHNDDMALGAYNVMKARGRTSIKIGGCDGMPPALQAVTDGRMVATVRNPSCLIHGGAIIAGVAAIVSGEKAGMGPGMIPKHVVIDGPVVTKATSPPRPTLPLRSCAICFEQSRVRVSLEQSAISQPPRLELVPSAGMVRPNVRTPPHSGRGRARMAILGYDVKWVRNPAPERC
jgi:ABC-type sugar transport system substrate-binding protein